MRTSGTKVVAAGVFLLFGTMPLSAQSPSPLTKGTRVRVTAPTVRKKPLVGTLVRLETGRLSVELDRDAGLETIPRSAVTRLEVSRGQRRHTVKGALYGFGVAATGMVVAIAATGGTNGSEDLALAAIGVVGASGAALGAFMGAMTKTDRWEDLGPARWRVIVGPTRDGGVGVQVRLAFGRRR